MIVGLLGAKGSGKDTFAARLVTHHGFTRLAFADPLKDLALDINPTIVDAPLVDLIDEFGWDRSKAHPRVRLFLQNLGVAARTHLHADVWVDALARYARRIPGPVVVTDVRFLNECQWVHANRGITVRIHRPSLHDRDTHVSETELSGFVADHLIVNDGTVAELHASADYFAGSVNFATTGRIV